MPVATYGRQSTGGPKPTKFRPSRPVIRPYEGKTLATEKQIAANRANAKRSTGPRTAAGKLKSSRNAYRHGLSSSMPLAQRCGGQLHGA